MTNAEITAQTVEAILPSFLALTNLTFDQFTQSEKWKSTFAEFVAVNIAQSA